MDKFDSLRNSIKQILEQEELQSPLDLAISDLNNILYKKRYTIGYTDYIGLNHFVEVVRVYSNLTGEFSEFVQNFDADIKNIKQIILNKFKRFKPSNTDEEAQDLALTASHKLKNNNIINENDSKSEEFLNDLNRILNLKLKISEVDEINKMLSSQLGLFFEFYLEKSIKSDILNSDKEKDFKFEDSSKNSRLELATDVSLKYFKILYGNPNLALDEFNLTFFREKCPLINDKINKCASFMNDLLAKINVVKNKTDIDMLTGDLFWSNTRDDQYEYNSRYDYSIYVKEKYQSQIILNLDLKVTGLLAVKPTDSPHVSVLNDFPNCVYFCVANFIKKKSVFADCKINELDLEFKYAILGRHESKDKVPIGSESLRFSQNDFKEYSENLKDLRVVYKNPTLDQIYFRHDILTYDYASKVNRLFFEQVKKIIQEKIDSEGVENIIKKLKTNEEKIAFVSENPDFEKISRDVFVNFKNLNNLMNDALEKTSLNNRIIIITETEKRGGSFYDIRSRFKNYINLFLEKIDVGSKHYYKFNNNILNSLLDADGNNLSKFVIEYFESNLPREENSSHNVKGNIISEGAIRNVIRNILEEGDKKKSYSGSHPEESYGWSAKEEDFMFDMPGLTTWEKDRQRVKEYLRSMGMLAPKKEKKK